MAALACTLGILPQARATLCGLAALPHTSAVAFQALKYADAACLLRSAWGTLRDTSTLRAPDEPRGALRARRPG